MNRRRLVGAGLLMLPAAGGVTLVLIATRLSVGVSPDSVWYITAARQLAAGNGLVVPWGADKPRPMTWWPPLFPMALAAIGKLGPDPSTTARCLNAFLLGATILLIGLIVWQSTGYLWLGVLGAAALAASRVMLKLHSMAWSEPAFLFFGVAGLFLLAVYAFRGGSLILAMGSCALALCWLTRYAGAAMVAAGTAGLLLAPGRVRHRFLPALAVAVIASLPMAAWMARNAAVGASPTSRRLAWHPALVEFLQKGGATIAGWMLPRRFMGTVGHMAILFVLAGAVGGLTVAARRRAGLEHSRRDRLYANTCWIFGIFLAIYALFVLVARSFFDAGVRFDDRILSPLLVAGLVVCLLGACWVWEATGRSAAAAVVAMTGCFGLLAVRAPRAMAKSIELSRTGQGFCHQIWRCSPTIATIQNLPQSVRLYSNAPDAIYLWTGRNAFWLPRKEQFTRCGRDKVLTRPCRRLQEQLQQGAAVVFFRCVSRRARYMPSEAQLKEVLNVVPIAETADGAIYALRPPGAEAIAGETNALQD